MPSYLSDVWADDLAPWRFLKMRGYKRAKGVIHPPHEGYMPSALESHAIDYLCFDWDWSYDPKEMADG